MKERKFYTPEQVIMGVKPYGSSPPDEVAFNALAFSLDTEKLAFVYHVEDDVVHYAGSESVNFASKGSTWTPLMGALLEAPGAYIVDELSYSLLVIKNDESYQTFSGTYDQMRALSDQNQLSYSVLGDESDASLWTTQSTEKSKASRRVNNMIALCSGVAMVTLSSAWIALIVGESMLLKSSIKIDSGMQDQLSQAINSLPTHHPIDSVLEEMEMVKSVAAKSGGWVNRYEVKDGATGFSLTLPPWVTQDYIRPLGNVRAEIDDVSSMIEVNKELPRARGMYD